MEGRLQESKHKDPYTRPNYTINSAMRQRRSVWTSRDLIFFFKKKKKLMKSKRNNAIYSVCLESSNLQK